MFTKRQKRSRRTVRRTGFAMFALRNEFGKGLATPKRR